MEEKNEKQIQVWGGVLAALFLAILICFAACKNSSSSGDETDPFSGTEWSGGGASLKFYSDGTVGGSGASTGGELRYKVSSSGGSYTATIYAKSSGQTINCATFTIPDENSSSGTYKLDGSSLSTTLKKVGGAGSSSGNNSGNSSSKANPFAGTEWSGGGSSLKFYSDGTVGGSGASTGGELRYKVSSSGGSYTATIYAEVYGQTMNFATLTISSENSTSGTYKLDGSNLSTTLQKSGGNSNNGEVNYPSNVGGSSSIDKDDSNNTSNDKGTKGGSSGDQFMNTTWSGDGLYLDFDNYGNVTYEADGLYFHYDYYFKSTGGSYTAKIYDNNTLMLTFEFSIANPKSGTLTFGSSSNSHTTLKRYSSSSEPTEDSNPADDTWYDQNEYPYQDSDNWQY